MKHQLKIVALFLAMLTSPSWAQQIIPVFVYHQISTDGTATPEVIPLQRFSEQLNYLKQEGYTTVTVNEVMNYMNGAIKLPPKSVALTFDDGWRSGLLAVNELNKLNFKATFFIIGGTFYEDIYITEEELVDLSSNKRFEIGSHTITHFMKWVDNLNNMDPEMILDEMRTSKAILEGIIGKPVTSFSWPFGFLPQSDELYLKLVGYGAAVNANNSARNLPGNSPLLIGRLNMSGTCTLADFKKMLTTGLQEDCKPSTKR